jgi:hypothetical protein
MADATATHTGPDSSATATLVAATQAVTHKPAVMAHAQATAQPFATQTQALPLGRLLMRPGWGGDDCSRLLALATRSVYGPMAPKPITAKLY